MVRSRADLLAVLCVQFPERFRHQNINFVLVYEADTGVTKGVVEGIESNALSQDVAPTPLDWDIDDVEDMYSDESTNNCLRSHPLHLPYLLLDLFIRENMKETKDIHHLLGEKEDATGISDWFFDPGREAKDADDSKAAKAESTKWDEAIQSLMKEWRPTSRLQNRIPFQERRWVFIINYIKFLRESQVQYKEACQAHTGTSTFEDSAWDQFSEVLDNMGFIVNEYLNEVQCLYRRAQSTVDLVSSISSFRIRVPRMAKHFVDLLTC